MRPFRYEELSFLDVSFSWFKGDIERDEILALILTTGFYRVEKIGDWELTRLVNVFKIRFNANVRQKNNA